jgi:hypothetical protein
MATEVMHKPLQYLDWMDRISNVWMNVRRSDIATRFDKVRDSYLGVSIRDALEGGKRRLAQLAAEGSPQLPETIAS